MDNIAKSNLAVIESLKESVHAQAILDKTSEDAVEDRMGTPRLLTPSDITTSALAQTLTFTLALPCAFHLNPTFILIFILILILVLILILILPV